MRIQTYKMRDGTILNIFDIKQSSGAIGRKWKVYVGSNKFKPMWIPLRFTEKRKPYIYVKDTKFFLEEFKIGA